MNTKRIGNTYQDFIHVSRYARWLENEGRRENWYETVQRYIDFMQNRFKDAYSQDEYDEVKNAIMELKVLPSMRALMTAGEALERENVAGYNCAYVAIDSPRAFDEALYVLMNGTGIGFSVEYEFISQMPKIADELFPTETTIVVNDSKLGWAKAYKELIGLLYTGQIPNWDMSRVRPKGARLKTFGGRASGPEPLNSLFEFTVNTFKNAKGRQLKAIEAHDIMCKVGEIVVVGGVRRAALISFSDLGDFEMAKAKSGQWWEDNPQRALANNTAVYKGKPSIGQFLREWRNLYDSKSGERGLQNIEADKKHFQNMGRREYDSSIRGNPCLTYDTRLLTEDGLQKIGDLAASGEEFKVCNGNGKYSDSTAFFTGIKKVFTVNLSNGLSIDLTGNHVIEVMSDSNAIEVAVSDLEPGMKVLPFYSHDVWSGGTTIPDNDAVALGLLFGDGFVQKNGGTSVYITTRESEVIDFLTDHFGSQFVSIGDDKYKIIGGVKFAAQYGFGFVPLPDRNLPNSVFEWSAQSVQSFFKGVWSANGSSQPTYNRISLKGTNRKMIGDMQKLLSALGFNAYVTTNSPSEIEWDNGVYISKESYYLNIGGAYQYVKFQKEVGFLHYHKMVPPVSSGETYRPRLVTVNSVQYKGVEMVYDFNEPQTHWGWANGMKVHNCNEVRLLPMQFCNLSEVVVSPDDDWDSIKDKVRLATIIGTWQSSLTNFKYLRRGWKKTTEAERLLGVSMTGIFGNKMLYDVNSETEKQLTQLKDYCVEVNAIHANRLGIEESVATTVVKPAGTTSQLTLTSSGIHPWHSKFYIRRVRGDNKDPMTQMLKDSGVPWEADVMKPNDTTVFSFPIKAPDDAITRNDVSAVEHLEVWRMFRNNWTEHNPSVTINVKEDEWVEVAAWVYGHFDEIGGVSFLPYSDHTYQQAPYEDITEKQYIELAEKMPAVDWDLLNEYELTDNTSGSQELACSSGVCEIVDIGEQ